MLGFRAEIAAAALAVCLAGPAAACIVAQSSLTAYPGSVTSGPGLTAWYDDPVTRYPHFVLGRQHEPETLWVDLPGNHGTCGHALTLPGDYVFEDTAPRPVDLDGDGLAEVVTVRSHRELGAQLAVYGWRDGALELIAEGHHIGQARRWLAIAAVADLDGDGAVEIAWVDRPHLAKVLRIWRWTGAGLEELARVEGVTNHRIGDPGIAGGLRDCGPGPEIVLATADWSGLVAVRLGEDVGVERLDGRPDAAGFAGALDCR